MPDVEQCSVTGSPCTGKGCKANAEVCVVEADRILSLKPIKWQDEIQDTADKLGIEGELYELYVHDRAHGTSRSITLDTETDDTLFDAWASDEL